MGCGASMETPPASLGCYSPAAGSGLSAARRQRRNSKSAAATTATAATAATFGQDYTHLQVLAAPGTGTAEASCKAIVGSPWGRSFEDGIECTDPFMMACSTTLASGEVVTPVSERSDNIEDEALMTAKCSALVAIEAASRHLDHESKDAPKDRAAAAAAAAVPAVPAVPAAAAADTDPLNVEVAHPSSEQFEKRWIHRPSVAAWCVRPPLA